MLATKPELPVHPAAEIFPLMSGAEFDALVADIREHGLRDPIVLTDGAILDGRNRYRACRMLGIEARTQEWDGRGSAEAYVVSHNLHRRHLNESQRAMIAARLATLKTGSVAAQRQKAAGAGIPAPLSNTEAARLFSIEKSTVSAAKKILNEATPEEIESIKAGKLSVNKVDQQLREGIPASQRAAHREKVQLTGKKKRQQTVNANAQIWSQLKDALINLTGLPAADDVARIARGYDRTNTINKKLEAALSWLKEFDNAWSNSDEA